MSEVWPLIGLLREPAKYIFDHALDLCVGAALGWVGKELLDRWRMRNARAVWRPFLTSDLHIIMGRFDDPDEPSGVFGVGDAMALAEVQRYLSTIGGTGSKVVYTDRVAGSLNHTLISIAGPDNNDITCQAMGLLGPTFVFNTRPDGVEIIEDTQSEPHTEYVAVDGELDYGLILYADNPFHPDNRIITLAGIRGHGTWAAANYLVSAELLKQREGKKGHSFECLVKAHVVQNTPQYPELVAMRELSNHPQESSDAIAKCTPKATTA